MTTNLVSNYIYFYPLEFSRFIRGGKAVLLTKESEHAYNGNCLQAEQAQACGHGGTGRRARLRGVWFYCTSSSLVPGTILWMTMARVRQAAAGRRTGLLCRQFTPGQIATPRPAE